MRFGETIYGVMRHFVQPVLPSVLALFAPFIVAAPEPRDDAHFQDNASNHPPKSDADAAERTALEARVSVLLRDKLQAFGCIMRTSDLENDIPVLDPLKVKPKNITPAFGPDVFDVRFSNMKFEGLSDFILNQVSSDFRDFRIKISVLIPRVTTNLNYNVTGSLYDLFRVAGAGEARIEYTDVFMRTVLYLDIIDNKLQLAFADQPYVDFSSAQVKVNGSNGPSSNRHFNDLSHQVAPIVFWVFAEDVASALEPHLEFYLNAQLARISLPPLAYALRDRVQPPKELCKMPFSLGTARAAPRRAEQNV
ncbi:uncharacterized protein LOC111243363 isoform X1 [Varroa destructor]|uniref:Uncharacterized protein n=1 Tax=Varroa destructor TaxID=109461 RepID=A0A7M7JCT0_VARDE|nr:uncharacterized protein LOC111243363 isoform X1 [Varroa destructor]XP_022644539.1 uncharacterized protein LOC111243363 isoform X1 [Varroa destructor]XP_022644540.1 uncharacterized protein LOC111243363 isoform X1 [Varroa destructor]